MPMIPAIAAQNVCFTYGEQEALHDVTLSIPEGSYAGLIGPNGGGKTTLLRLIIGLMRPSSGTVRVFGQDPFVQKAEGGIGYVPQRIVRSAVGFPATVREVIESGCRRHLHSGRCCTDAAAALGIGDFLQRPISALSGGERQKVFIARALAPKPKLLILDEPTTGIDEASRNEFYTLLRTLHSDGITILLVSHDTDVVAGEVQQVLCLDRTLVTCDVHPTDPHHHHSHAAHAHS